MANWDVDEDLVEGNAIIQSYRKTVTDGAFSWIVIIQSDLRILDTRYLVAESVDSRVRSNIVFVILSCQSSIDQGDSDLPSETDEKKPYHVLDAVISVSGIMKRTLFIDDVNASSLRADLDLLDII